MKIVYENIDQRIRKLNNKYSTPITFMREAQIYTNKNVFCENNAVNSIKHWESLSEDIDSAFLKALDIFDELCINSSPSVIRTSCEALLENVDKIRDQVQLANSLKYRMGVMRKKTATKINKQHDMVTNNIRAAIANVHNVLSQSSPKAAINPTTPSPDSANSDGVAQECYNALYDKCMVIKECDRIIKNYASISRRFNIDRIVSDIKYEDDSYLACYEIASCIDTYNIPFTNKYNSALETAAYAFDKHYMNYPKDSIIQAVTDYFIFSNVLKESNIPEVEKVARISVLFEQSDFDILPWRNKETITTPYQESAEELAEGYGVEFDYITEGEFKKQFRKQQKAFNKDLKKSAKKLIKDVKRGNPEERKDKEVLEMIDDFRKDCMKDDSDKKSKVPLLKSLINKIFVKSPAAVADGLPNIFSIIRVGFILSTTVINPIISVVALIADTAIKLTLTRKQMVKVVNAYENEIKTVKDKIEKVKDDQTKDNLEKYLKELEKDYEKLDEYCRSVHSEEENDERDEAKWAAEYDDDDDFDFGEFGDDDFDFEEAASILCISKYMESISESIIDTSVDGIIAGNICKLDNDSIDAVTDFSITVPVILEKDKLKECLISHRNDLRESGNSVLDYMRIDCLNENIYKLEKAAASYNTSNTTRDAMLYLSCLNEITKINSNGYVNEMDFTNTIKLAVSNLKKTAMKLSDKEKQISSSIDVAANNTAKGIEQAMSNNNREAVIRGSIIPSASKCIKIAITTGIAWAINPAIAVIGAIGAFACSKKLQGKERQLVLDDIEIELKMCERYMRIAEDKGDMKKVRQIEQIQRNLERQRQRIKYKMVVVYNQKVPDAKEDND